MSVLPWLELTGPIAGDAAQQHRRKRSLPINQLLAAHGQHAALWQLFDHRGSRAILSEEESAFRDAVQPPLLLRAERLFMAFEECAKFLKELEAELERQNSCRPPELHKKLTDKEGYLLSLYEVLKRYRWHYQTAVDWTFEDWRKHVRATGVPWTHPGPGLFGDLDAWCQPHVCRFDEPLIESFFAHQHGELVTIRDLWPAFEAVMLRGVTPIQARMDMIGRRESGEDASEFIAA